MITEKAHQGFRKSLGMLLCIRWKRSVPLKINIKKRFIS